MKKMLCCGVDRRKKPRSFVIFDVGDLRVLTNVNV